MQRNFEKTERAIEFIENEKLKIDSDRTSLRELRDSISDLAQKQRATDEYTTSKFGKVDLERTRDQQIFEEFKSSTEKQFRGLDCWSTIDTLSARVDTWHVSFSKFDAEFKPNVLALIDAHHALASVNDTCQKLNSKCDKLDDAVRHGSKSVDANTMTLDTFTRQLNVADSTKLPVAKFTELVDTDWNSHVKSFSELQTLVKSLCETVKNSVSFTADSPHDHTREIKYEEEFNLTARKSTTLVQSIRTGNGLSADNRNNNPAQMDRINKLFTKFLAGSGVGVAAGLVSQLVLVDKSYNIQE